MAAHGNHARHTLTTTRQILNFKFLYFYYLIMGFCIYCKKKESKHESSHYFRFPKQDYSEWIRNMGRENWIPNKSSALCSDHFTKNCFDYGEYRVRLIKGAVPTIFGNSRDKEEMLDMQTLQAEAQTPPVPHPPPPPPEVPRPCSLHSEACTSPIPEPIPDLTIPHSSRSRAKRWQLVEHDHTYVDTPINMRRKLDIARKSIVKFKSERKVLRQRLKRSKITINSLKSVNKDLREQKLVSDTGLYCLESWESKPAQLFARMNENIKKSKLSRKKYAPELRSFALTLHFYSPKAYDYVRKTFDSALPHPSVLRSWYSSIDAEPGFSEECFRTLKVKAEECKLNGKRLICALMYDEMGIKRGCQRARDGIVRGHVDIGCGLNEGEDLPVASEAGVLLVVPLDQSWKLPLGYFMTNGLNADVLQTLFADAISRLHDIGVEVSSLTFDGPPAHFACARLFGAQLTIQDCKPFFTHPSDPERRVFVILDPSHMLKLIRNAFHHSKVFEDENGGEIKWQYIDSLASLQQQEGLRLGNKLRAQHLDFKKQIMKVYLAAQTLSASVATAIEFCDKVLKLPQFRNSEATVKFLRMVDCIFDFLNTRNPWAKGFKSPLRRDNEYIWRTRILESIEYLSKLRLHEKNKSLVITSARKTGFVGFYTSVKAVIGIFDEYVKPEGSPLRYLLTYKISQDHLELFFCAIRSRSGWCPNPTVAQFVSAFKRLLVRQEVQSTNGNASAQDSTTILSVSSSHKRQKLAKVDRYDPRVYREAENARVCQKYGLDETSAPQNIDTEMGEYLHFAWCLPNSMTEFSQQAVGYIAGFVVRSIRSRIKCGECLDACESLHSTNNSTNLTDGVALIVAKTHGGLTVPSSSVVNICRTVEKLFRKACNCNHGKPPPEKNFTAMLCLSVKKELLASKTTLFQELDEHFTDTYIFETATNHLIQLTHQIIVCYIEIRMYALTKNYSYAITGTSIRHFLTRQIIWKGH